MYEGLRPGARIEWRDATAARLSALRTDVAAFVGIARRGPLDTPVPVESFPQFEAHFGGFTGAGYLAYAVRGFFENGGRRCWVVRVASREGRRPARPAEVLLREPSPTPPAPGRPVWRLRASSCGTWGNRLSVTLTPTYPAQTVASPPWTSERFATVDSCAGFSRGDLVRLTQPGLPDPLWRIVGEADVVNRRLYWTRPAAGIDPHQPAQVASLVYTLTVFLAGRPIAFETGLSLVPQHARWGPRALRELPPALAPESEGSLPRVAPPVVIELPGPRELCHALGPDEPARPLELEGVPLPLDVRPGMVFPLAGGGDGLAELTAFDFVGEPTAAGDSDEVRCRKGRGLRAIEAVDEIAIVAVPDILIQPVREPEYDPPEIAAPDPCRPCPPPNLPALVHQPPREGELPPVFSDEDIYRVQATLVQICDERRDRFAILDPPAHIVQDGARGLAEAVAWRAHYDSKHAALYHAWVRVADPLGLDPTRLVPACGHVAGQFALHDLEFGVHRAPANRVLGWIQDVGAAVDDALHGELNQIGVNVIRAEGGRGLRILGARTLSSDGQWRYLNVRRLVMMVMKALDLGTQWAVFEPNDDPTRSQIAQTIAEFLTALWERGALVGQGPSEAFFVRCDETNNPPEGRAEGRLVAEVGLAPSQPCEYVVLRVGREGNAFEVTEAEARAGVAA